MGRAARRVGGVGARGEGERDGVELSPSISTTKARSNEAFCRKYKITFSASLCVSGCVCVFDVTSTSASAVHWRKGGVGEK